MTQPKTQKPVAEGALVKTAREIEANQAQAQILVDNLKKVEEIIQKAQAHGAEIQEQLSELNHKHVLLSDKLSTLH